MIWSNGELVPDDGLKVSVLDRAFEHGLGLFETFRTWNGYAALLDRHLMRLTRSASNLGIHWAPESLPRHEDVADLLRAAHIEGEVMLRLTMSGGIGGSELATLWMRVAPLPPPPREQGARVAIGRGWEVSAADPTARHKMLNYWARRSAFERATANGYDEILSTCPQDRYWEGSRTNAFLVSDEGGLITPHLDGPIVPGVMRGLVLELARDLSLQIREVDGLTPALFRAASEMFLTNAVRAIIPVARAGEFEWPSPGPCTVQLQQRLTARVTQGEQSR